MTSEMQTEEIKKRFLDLVWKQIDILEKQEGKAPIREVAEACMFQLLSAIDSGVTRGKNLELPAFILAPYVPEGYTASMHEAGVAPFPDNRAASEQIKGDISGTLHDTFMKMRAERHQRARNAS